MKKQKKNYKIKKRAKVYNQNNSDISNRILTSGITLVALVVTIVVLLILAGITINYMLGDNNIFTKASQAKEQTAMASAREKLENVLLQAKIDKHVEIKYNQNEYLDELILNKVLGSKINGDVVISDGYAFILDRSIPWIGEYIGKEEDLIFPELETNVTIAADKKTASLTIKAREKENGIRKIEVLQDGIVIKPFSYENETGQITETYEIVRNGKYVVKATALLTSTKVENITDLLSSVEYSPNGNDTWKKEHKVTLKVKENIENVKSIKYQWTDTTVEPEESTFITACNNGQTIIENTLTGKYYLWTLLEDNGGNSRIEKSEAFYFDNQGPIVELESIPISKVSFKLTTTASDKYSGIDKYEFYIDEESQGMQLASEYTWSGKEMARKECYVIVTDKVGNSTKRAIEARTMLHSWVRYEKVENRKYQFGEWKIVSTQLDVHGDVYFWRPRGCKNMWICNPTTGVISEPTGIPDNYWSDAKNVHPIDVSSALVRYYWKSSETSISYYFSEYKGIVAGDRISSIEAKIHSLSIQNRCRI